MAAQHSYDKAMIDYEFKVKNPKVPLNFNTSRDQLTQVSPYGSSKEDFDKKLEGMSASYTENIKDMMESINRMPEEQKLAFAEKNGFLKKDASGNIIKDENGNVQIDTDALTNFYINMTDPENLANARVTQNADGSLVMTKELHISLDPAIAVQDIANGINVEDTGQTDDDGRRIYKYTDAEGGVRQFALTNSEYTALAN